MTFIAEQSVVANAIGALARVKKKREDLLNRQGAMALAKRLETFWHDRGYLGARFWAEPIGERFVKIGTHEIYRVVSNLINGMPPRYRDGRFN